MAQAANARAAKLESPSLVSNEFDDNGRPLRDFLIDVKVVQLESVIVVNGGHN
jgi:hypothetical protein